MPDAHLSALAPPRRLWTRSLLSFARRRYRSAALAATALALAACASAPRPEAGAPAARSAPDRPAPEIALYEAIRAEFEARGWRLAIDSRPFLTAATAFEPVHARLRKRRVARVLKLPRGGALRVVVEYQRDAGLEGAPRWTPAQSDELRGEARREELELGRAIEARFHGAR